MLHRLLLLAGVLLAVLTIGTSSGSAQYTSAAPTLLSGNQTRSFAAGTCDTSGICWNCTGPVALDSMVVTVETSAAHIDAVHLASGCNGTIGSLVVQTRSADGVKV